MNLSLKAELDEQIAEWTAQQTRTITEAITKEERLEDQHAEMRALEKAYEEATEVGAPVFPLKVRVKPHNNEKIAWTLGTCAKRLKRKGAQLRGLP